MRHRVPTIVFAEAGGIAVGLIVLLLGGILAGWDFRGILFSKTSLLIGIVGIGAVLTVLLIQYDRKR